ncbi:MAG: GNAT family N-acetyltransferase [Oscillospiraceae bacterium]
MDDIIIRMADPADAEQLLAIYSYYVKNTAITFEYDVPAPEEFRARICHTLEKYPYLVAEKQGRAVGYAYAGAFKGRAAYDWSVEVTVYVDKDLHRCGIGKMLYSRLEELLKAMGVTNLYACIGVPAAEDEFLTRNSIDFHQHLGYVPVGEFHKCGYKFDRWYNMVWAEKIVGEHRSGQEDVINFNELNK